MQRFSFVLRAVSTTVVLAVALLTFGSASMTTTAAAPTAKKPGGGDMTVETVTGTALTGEQLSAEFTPEKFKGSKDGLWVTGELVGTLGGDEFTETVTFPVQSINGTDIPGSGSSSDLALAAAGSCDILDLVLGPLNLDLLGLEVFLDTVTLEIVATPGAGNLLGNLLCAVTGLLDGPGPLQNLLRGISNLLNQILGALNLGL